MNKLTIILLIIICICIPFIANSYTDLFPKKSGYREDIKFISVSIPESRDYQRCFTSNGRKLDPTRNFNSSSCVKLDYVGMKECCPEILDLYFNEETCKRAAVALGIPKLYLNDPKADVNCIFMRKYVYGDHLAFHYDNNFSCGTRYTAVIPVYVTENNTSEFIIQDRENRLQIVKIPPEQAVVYNGWQIRHAITGQVKDAIRIVVVVHLYDNPAMNTWGRMRKHARDFTYKSLSL